MKHKDPKWRLQQIQQIRELTARTPAQQLISDLAHITGEVPDERSPPPTAAATLKDKKDLDALLRAQAAHERMTQIANRAQRLVRGVTQARGKSARQVRNKRLIDHGLLVELAGLHERTPAELLGLLLLAGKTEDPARWAQWAAIGGKRLAERDAARKTKAKTEPHDP